MKKSGRLNFMDDEDENPQIGQKYFDQQEFRNEQVEQMEYMNHLVDGENIYEYDSIYNQIQNQKVGVNLKKASKKGKTSQSEVKPKQPNKIQDILNRANQRKVEKNIMLSNLQFKQMKREGRADQDSRYRRTDSTSRRATRSLCSTPSTRSRAKTSPMTRASRRSSYPTSNRSSKKTSKGLLKKRHGRSKRTKHSQPQIRRSYLH